MKKLYLGLWACTIMLFTSCADDELINDGVRPVSGNEVIFGASSGKFNIDPVQTPTHQVGTRTVYGVEGEQNFANYTTLTVHWTDGDKIRIYSPQAQDGYKTADYNVSPILDSNPEDNKANGTLVKAEDVGIHWGSSEEHDFYAFYPVDVSHINMEGLETGTTVTATIPTAQEHGTLYRYDTTTGEQSENGNWKIIAPDMNFAMMTAQARYNPNDPGFDGKIELQFKPFVTVLDVVVNGPQDASQGAFKIVQVLVYSETQPIVGDFTYDFATGKFSGFPETLADHNIASVDCMYNNQPLELEKDQKLNVKFFLLPQDIRASELTVSVFLEGGHVISKKLAEPNTDLGSINFEQGKIIKIKTPYLKDANTNNWMNLIHSDVYFASQLSLPGSKHSYTYTTFTNESALDATNEIMQSFQQLDISQQFDAGVRSFDIKVNTTAGNKIYAGGKNLGSTLHDFLDLLKEKLDESPTEAVTIGINYVNDRNNGSTWVSQLVENIKSWSGYEEYLKAITSETTMGEMRKHIGIMVHCEGNIPTTFDVGDKIGLVANYSSSVQHRDIQQYTIGRGGVGGNMFVQQLYQVNNPDISSSDDDFGYRTGAGLVPYYITDPDYSADNANPDLIAKKKELIENLFNQSRKNNQLDDNTKLKNIYVNDLGGFCVVKNSGSTGFVNWSKYVWRQISLIGDYAWREPALGIGSVNGIVYDYAKLPEGYTYYNKSSNSPGTPENTDATWCRIEEDGSYSMGQGGNPALFASKINPEARDLIYNLVKEGRTPLGIVYMNYAGTNNVEIAGHSYDVQGISLPSLIMSNNFKFPLVRKSTSSNNNVKEQSR